MKITYDIGTNFDNELIKMLSTLKIVKSIYGKLASDVVGGGRATFILPNISKEQLEQHINLAHKHNIEFNYLLNALCIDNREFTGKTNLEIRNFIGYLKDINVDTITIGNPFLLKIVKDIAPQVKISTSIYNDIDSLERIKAWEELGANELTLHYGFNRNFKKLKQALKTTDLNLRIIANNTCLHDCIHRTNHANTLAHASQSNHESEGFYIDFYSLNCGKEKYDTPAKLISSDWIRPEDVHLYEEMCDELGKTNITLKLTDRSRPTDWIFKVAKAYAEKSYKGNLFDILNLLFL